MQKLDKVIDKKSSSKSIKSTPKKALKVKSKIKAPIITDEMFETWFLKRSQVEFKLLSKKWNEKKLKIRLVQQKDYDDWLNYFKKISMTSLQILSSTGKDIIDVEGYAALLRWRDIISNPARIDKLHQSNLRNPSLNKNSKTIVELALQNDRLGVLEATRDKIAEKLEKGAGARDTSALAHELTSVMSDIDQYKKRQGPKKGSKFGDLMSDMETIKPRKRGNGSRNTSFASRTRVTIEDIEG